MKEEPKLLPGDNVDEVEACRLLNVSHRTMHRYRVKGLIPHHKVGNRIYYKLRDIIQLLED